MRLITCGACGKRWPSSKKACCDACKQFFRRLVAERKLFQCRGSGHCASAKCQSCRFDKCLLAGLDPRSVMIEWRPTSDPNYFATVDRRVRELLRQRSGAENNSRQSAVVPVPLPSEQWSNAKMFEYFLGLEQRRERIRNAFGDLPDNYMDQFHSFGELFTSGHNILAIADTFTAHPSMMSRSEFDTLMDDLQRSNFFHPKCVKSILVQLLLYAGMARALPAFGKLSLRDQAILFRSISSPLDFFYQCYHSAQLGTGTWTRGDGFHYVNYFRVPKYHGDERLAKLVERVFTRSVEPFMRNPISREEFILCVAIIHSHSAVSDLSPEAMDLLYSESVRYSKLLLWHLQSTYGAAAGASRYANCLYLVECAFQNVPHYGQFLVYLEAFYLGRSIATEFPDYLRTLFNV